MTATYAPTLGNDFQRFVHAIGTYEGVPNTVLQPNDSTVIALYEGHNGEHPLSITISAEPDIIDLFFPQSDEEGEGN